jgi:hypothetical protein
MDTFKQFRGSLTAEFAVEKPEAINVTASGVGCLFGIFTLLFGLFILPTIVFAGLTAYMVYFVYTEYDRQVTAWYNQVLLDPYLFLNPPPAAWAAAALTISMLVLSWGGFFLAMSSEEN